MKNYLNALQKFILCTLAIILCLSIVEVQAQSFFQKLNPFRKIKERNTEYSKKFIAVSIQMDTIMNIQSRMINRLRQINPNDTKARELIDLEKANLEIRKSQNQLNEFTIKLKKGGIGTLFISKARINREFRNEVIKNSEEVVKAASKLETTYAEKSKNSTSSVAKEYQAEAATLKANADKLLAELKGVSLLDANFDTKMQAMVGKLTMYAEQVKAGEAESQTLKDLDLQADIAFGTGKSDLQIEGKKFLDEVIAKTNQDIESLQSRFLDSTIEIFINCFGYADGEGKTATNQILSENRANSVFSYIRDNLTKKVSLKISKNVVGKGETEMPDNSITDYQEKDIRRRICKFSCGLKLLK
jgi:outer membrane protein OmpA-like peptidoglycan-associated protein